jgi:aerobic carbon-monoxide dehydrogenase medium subunit
VPTLLPPFSIHQPATLDEASQMLVEFGDDGCAYAGGTELLLAMKQGGLRYGHLVDLKTIPGLDRVEVDDGQLRIGALATHLSLERSALVQQHLPVLVDLERRVANVRVRATGTLGGNLCFGEPHSDPATLLLCLDAQLETTRRRLPLDQFLVGPYETALEPGELLRSVIVPRPASSLRASYQKFQVHEFPMLGLALVVDASARRARVAVGSVSPTPRRSPEAEALLLDGHLEDAAGALADAAELIDDKDGSADYKRHLIHVFLERAWRVTNESISE